MEFVQIYDEGVSQYSYIIGCDQTRDAIVIDPQRSIEEYLKIAHEKRLNLIAATETHIHADFASGIQEFIQRTSLKIYLSEEGKKQGWDYSFVKSQDNVEFVHHDSLIFIGKIKLKVIATPGHTPEHISFLAYDKDQSLPIGVFSGDFIFCGDLGRPDLLEKAAKIEGTMRQSAQTLFTTVQAFKKQSPHLIIWPGHGCGSACGKSLAAMPYTTWGYEKETSPSLQIDDEKEFLEYILNGQKEPPLYFARMKTFNNKGGSLIQNQKNSRSFSHLEIDSLIKQYPELIFADTRIDRDTFMKKHLKGSIFAPFPSLSTAIGSTIQDSKTPIVIITEEHLEKKSIQRLINIGYDNILGTISTKELEIYMKNQCCLESIATTDFSSISQSPTPITIVDVRSENEYAQHHLPQAIHAPYTRIGEWVHKLPKDKHLYIHCASGMRAAICSSFLKTQGFSVTFVNDSFGNKNRVSTAKTTCQIPPSKTSCCS